MTKDSDLALDVRTLADEPLLEEAMRAAGFELDSGARQPGAWVNSRGIPVDLMIPEALAGAAGRRGARIPPHSKHAARRADGLEAAVVDHAPMPVRGLDPDDARVSIANVAGPSALLVAKLQKLGERGSLAATLSMLAQNSLAGPATRQALIREMFAAGAEAPGSVMAGRAEEGVGEPLTVAAAVAALADDLLSGVRE